MWDSVLPYIQALGPTVGVCFLFYFVIKYVLEADRRERLAQSKLEAARDAEHAEADSAETAIAPPAAQIAPSGHATGQKGR